LEGYPIGEDGNEAQQLSWLLSRPTCTEYHHSLQMLTLTKNNASHLQVPAHAWSTHAHRTRDKDDVDKLVNFFIKYDPFILDLSLRCITTGVVAASSVNVDDS
jgi:hypothetical protein